jgi:arylsulfatase
MTPENNWSTEEAVMSQLDDIVGEVIDYLERNDLTDNTILAFTADNGAEVFTWPDGGMTPFAGAKGMIMEGGMRVPMIAQWPGHIQAGTVENGIMSGLDWFPTFVAAAGNPNIVEELKKGKTIDGTTYKVHLDGYNQMDLITGEGPSNRHEIYYFNGAQFGALRIDDFKYRFIDQPNGWFGGVVTLSWPDITNLRLDPFERAGFSKDDGSGSLAYYNWFWHEFWRFVEAQEKVSELAETFVEFPPMQKSASFNLDAIVEKLKEQHSAGN